MKTNVIAIGNSKGVRITKVILEQCHINKDVEMNIEEEKIVISAIKKVPREKWDQEFKKMKLNNDDSLIIDDNIDIETSEWQW